MNPPHVLGIPVDVTPHVLGIPVDYITPPSPSEFRDAARGMGMDIFWNHPIQVLSIAKQANLTLFAFFH